MKKVLIIAVSLIAFANIVFADEILEWAETLKSGEYICPYKMTSEYTGRTTSTCKIGITRGVGYTLSDCPYEVAKLDPLVKSGKCTFNPPQYPVYFCQYAQGTCTIQMVPGGISGSCPVGANVPFDQVIADYKAGKCYKN